MVVPVIRVHWMVFFFFSSRRRHTRYWRDWSSDVCSSDLEVLEGRDDHLAGDVAGRVSPHAVGHGQQPGPGVDRVLVVAADQTAVGAGGVAQRETHRTLLTSARSLPMVGTVVVSVVVSTVISAAPGRSGRCGSAGPEPPAEDPAPAAGRGRSRWSSRGPRRTTVPHGWSAARAGSWRSRR